MKKRILSFVLAIIMVVGLLPTTVLAEDAPVYVAQINETGIKYESVQEAVEAAKDGETITMIADHEVDCSGTWLTVERSLTIDLNGCEITANVTGEVTALIYAENGHLILKDSSAAGTGKIEVTSDGQLSNLLRVETTATALIESGNYVQDKSVNGAGMIDSRGSRILTINGGSFRLGNIGSASNGSPWILNTSGKNERKIIVNGGTFNADILHQYYLFEVEAQKEKALRNNGDGTWTMVNAVVYLNESYKSGDWYIQEVGYATLEEAVAAANGNANNAETAETPHVITLLADCTVNTPTTITGDVTIAGNYTITGATGDTPMISVAEDATLTVAGGDYQGTVSADNGGEIILDPAEDAVLSFTQDNISAPDENLCTVKLFVGDEHFETQVMKRGATADTPIVPAKIGHTLSDWYTSKEPSDETKWNFETNTVVEDTELYAKWIVNQYTITFVNEDGTELQSSEAAYGETPAYTGETPTKAADAQYTYTFDGWDKEIVSVTGEATYTATYSNTVNEYTIKFVDEDGTELQTGEVAYGDTPVYTGETPTKAADAQYTYTFDGWDKELAAVTGDATYTATYSNTVNKYTIKFVDEDGTELQGSEVAYGETPAYTGETPTKAATAQYTYTFKGWDKEIVAVTGNATYTAQYSSTVNKYTIKFVDEDGTELQTGEVAYGETPAYTGETPTKAATAQYTYTFKGWDKEIVAVTGNATYTAQYSSTVNKYTVTWIVDGVETTEQYEYGATPSFKGNTDKAATAQYTYTFKGWDKEIAAVTGDATYTAQYSSTVNKYTVTWIVDGNTTTEQYEYGATPSFKGNTDKAATAQYTYTFKGWDKEIAAVTGNATYTAQYSSTVNKYTVTWIVDGNTTTEQYEYGATPSFKGNTDKAATAQYTYTFKGWDKEIAAVTGNATYTAQYSSTVNKYTITWIVDGVETTEQYEYGATPSFKGNTNKAATAQYTYTFSGWTLTIEAVTGEATYTATYSSTVNKYTITFVNEDGTELQTGEVAYGETPAYTGATPTKAQDGCTTYTFAGWTTEIAAVTGEATYAATYTEGKSHSYGLVDGYGATCTDTGLTAGEQCSVCSEWSIEQEVIPALGHSWGETSYDFSEDGTACTAKRVCERDCEETAIAVITSEQTKEPDCTEMGETTYTATFAEQWAQTQTKVVSDIPVNNKHSFSSDWSYNFMNHWHSPLCGHDVVSDKAEHDFGNDLVCDICRYTVDYPGNSGSSNTPTLPDAGEVIVCNCENFADINTNLWYHKAIDYVVAKGLMSGVGNGKFDPDGSTSRAMLVTILWRLEGCPVVNEPMTYTDIPQNEWYSEAIRWATSENIVAGYGDSFSPNDPVTREQFAAILYRYEQYKGGGFKGAWMFLLDYPDRDDVSDWAYEAMCWITMNKIIQGKGDSSLDPKGSAKRCEAAQMLMQFIELE